MESYSCVPDKFAPKIRRTGKREQCFSVPPSAKKMQVQYVRPIRFTESPKLQRRVHYRRVTFVKFRRNGKNEMSPLTTIVPSPFSIVLIHQMRTLHGFGRPRCPGHGQRGGETQHTGADGERLWDRWGKGGMTRKRTTPKETNPSDQSILPPEKNPLEIYFCGFNLLFFGKLQNWDKMHKYFVLNVSCGEVRLQMGNL